MRVCLIAFALAASLSSTAQADETASPPAASGPRHGPVMVMPVTHVVGRRQGPGVLPVLSRSRFRYTAPDLERHATGAIVESVRHSPF